MPTGDGFDASDETRSIDVSTPIKADDVSQATRSFDFSQREPGDAAEDADLVDDPRGVSLRPGDSLDEFAILATLGQGAFADVYLARQTTADRLVAIKIVAEDRGELVHLARMDHTGIVRVFDRRPMPHGRGEYLYLEFVPGGTLEQVIEAQAVSGVRDGSTFLAAVDAALLRAGQALPERSALRGEIADQSWNQTVAWCGRLLADALAGAHEAGVLHLDIKPANVLLAADGVPKLTDFNVSVASESAGAQQRVGRGSLAWMSPEQIAALSVAVGGPTVAPEDECGTEIGEASDVYSLALSMYVLWRGSCPGGMGAGLRRGWIWTQVRKLVRIRVGAGVKVGVLVWVRERDRVRASRGWRDSCGRNWVGGDGMAKIRRRSRRSFERWRASFGMRWHFRRRSESDRRRNYPSD